MCAEELCAAGGRGVVFREFKDSVYPFFESDALLFECVVVAVIVVAAAAVVVVVVLLIVV